MEPVENKITREELEKMRDEAHEEFMKIVLSSGRTGTPNEREDYFKALKKYTEAEQKLINYDNHSRI